MSFESILIPTDGSEGARDAAETGFGLAEELNAEVHVVSVVDTELVNTTTYTGTSPKNEARIEERAREHVDTLADEAEKRGLTVTRSTPKGVPASRIVGYAEDEDIDLIVMGTAGRGGFRRALIGSVADKVVRTSPVPVVTVRPDRSDGSDGPESPDED
ncbi:MAG: universal stress protein [Halobacteriales archaeon]|nr:universal stress protein [Halobacteriales archaeon]